MSHTTVLAPRVQTGDRQRQQFDEGALQDLADSIRSVGLIHAPVVEMNSLQLIAGERRLRALSIISGTIKYGDSEYTWPEIPVHLIERDDPRLLFEIELEENIRRVNLSPMEEARALANLHNLRLEVNPQQTVKATAQEISTMRGKDHNARDETRLADSIIVDQFKDHPKVQEAAKTSLRKAAKVAKKIAEREFLSALHAFENAPSNPLFTVVPGDCREYLPMLEAYSFDVLLFDPPYGVDANKFGEQAFILDHEYKDDWEFAKGLTTDILYHSQNFLKPNAHILQFCGFEQWHYWKRYYEAELRYTVWPRPLIWSKGTGHLPVPDYGPRYTYECILFAAVGKRRTASVIPDVLHYSPPRDKVHAAEKPADLLSALLDFVAKPGDRIIDPTVGSGSIFLGARGKEIYVTGIEAEPNSYAIAKERAQT